MTPMEQLKAMVAGKKVAFIGAGVSHKPCITMLAALGADTVSYTHLTLPTICSV